jgi:hypothetical protein
MSLIARGSGASSNAPPKINIELNESELFLAGLVGIRRRIDGSSLFGRCINRLYDQAKDTWDCDIEAACSELAAARALDRFWSGSVNTFQAPDLPGPHHIQVKYTHYGTGELILHPRCPDSDLYVLVTGKVPRFIVHGYMKGSEVRELGQDKAGNGSYWVRQDQLHDIAHLINTMPDTPWLQPPTRPRIPERQQLSCDDPDLPF